MEKIDFKKKYKDLYQPKTKPSIVTVPNMRFIMVDGIGDPNTSEDYRNACQILYGLSYTIKMSKMNNTQPEGYYEYVIPPLEGLWSVDDDSFRGQKKIENKDKFIWTIMIRQPEFVTQEVFEVAKEVLHKKKPNLNLDLARLVDWEEGLCAQIMHIVPYDDELDTIQILNAFIKDSGYQPDISVLRKHHEIYLSDPRKTDPKKLKTVIRHPIKPI